MVYGPAREAICLAAMLARAPEQNQSMRAGDRSEETHANRGAAFRGRRAARTACV